MQVFGADICSKNTITPVCAHSALISPSTRPGFHQQSKLRDRTGSKHCKLLLAHSHHGNMLGFTHCTSYIDVQHSRALNTRSLLLTKHVKVFVTRKLSH